MGDWGLEFGVLSGGVLLDDWLEGGFDFDVFEFYCGWSRNVEGFGLFVGGFVPFAGRDDSGLLVVVVDFSEWFVFSLLFGEVDVGDRLSD